MRLVRPLEDGARTLQRLADVGECRLERGAAIRLRGRTQVDGALLQQLRAVQAEELQRIGIGLDEVPAVGVEHHDRLRRRLDQDAVALLAFRQLLLRLVLRRTVGNEAVPEDAAVGELLRAREPAAPAHPLPRQHHAIFAAPGLQRLRRVHDARLDHREVVGVQALVHRRRVLAHLLGRHLIDVAHRLAGEGEARAAIGIQAELVDHPRHLLRQVRQQAE